MNTKLIMIGNAAFVGFFGILLSFLPQELIQFVDNDSSPFSILLAQLLGATYLGFASLNWLAKGNAIGGIYSRPVSVANFGQSFISATALLKFVWQTQNLYVGFFALGFLIFSVLFGLIMRGK